jgi:hypothetical protein
MPWSRPLEGFITSVIIIGKSNTNAAPDFDFSSKLNDHKMIRFFD